MSQWLKKLWKEQQSFIVFISLMLVFRSAVADWNEVPTGSMKPTIIEGDRIFVNKMAYDLRLPFTHLSLLTIADPARGDIVVFDSVAADNKLVKRVVGLPGDVVAMSDNVLTINGQPLTYRDEVSTVASAPARTQQNTRVKIENLAGREHLITVSETGSRFSSFAAVTVPSGHYLMLGDNRDNSADSRVIGLVPRAEIVGNANKVVLSFNYDNFYLPRSDRFFHPLYTRYP